MHETKDAYLELLTSPLAKALAALETHVGLTESTLAAADPNLKVAFRTAAIKSFEFTYELSLKLILRALENHPGIEAEAVDELSFRGVMRLAAERGFIGSPDNWHAYRHQRNKTSHSYNEGIADEVYSVLPAFIVDAKKLLTKLEAAADAR